jgi:hypothetical protein
LTYKPASDILYGVGRKTLPNLRERRKTVLGEYTYKVATLEDGTEFYVEFYTDEDGIRRVRELPYEEWLLCSIFYGE